MDDMEKRYVRSAIAKWFWLVMTCVFIYLWLSCASPVWGAEYEPIVRMVLEEADNEPFAGQIAVAGVAIDRVRDARWPDSLRAVLYQPFQFTAMAGPFRSHLDREVYRVRTAVEVARTGTRPCGKVLWYHTKWVKPSWRNRVTEKCRIGAHIFYGD